MIRDLRQAFRVLLQARGWTVIVLASLALGIGANTTFFSAINQVLLTTVPAQDADQLVRFGWYGENDLVRSHSEYGYGGVMPSGEQRQTTFSYPVYLELKEQADTLSEFMACGPFRRLNVSYEGEAELASTILVSGNYFPALGLPAALGRVLDPSDDDPAAPPAVMIAHGYWQRRFGGDEDVIGKPVQVGRVAATIVGVTAEDYAGVQAAGRTAADIQLPIALSEQLGGPEPSDATHFWLQLMGRLAPATTAEQVKGNLSPIFQATARDRLSTYVAGLSEEDARLSYNQDLAAIPQLQVESGARGIYDPNPNVSRDARILAVVVAIVLLIVCANVANLLLARASGRQHELGIRQSFGATRSRLVRQLLVESTLLATIGGGLGLVVAVWARQLLPFAQDAPLDWRVFGFAALLSLATGLIFSLVPALRATGGDLAGALKEGSRSVMGSRKLLSRGLLVVQVALSVALLVGAALFLTTLNNLRSVDVGFDPQNLVLVRVNPNLIYEDEERVAQLYDEMATRLEAAPGITSVSISQSAFLSGSVSTRSAHVPGSEGTEGETVHLMVVGPRFFETLGIPLLSGRDFVAQDRDEAPLVAIINQAAAEQILGNGSPLGQRMGWTSEERSEVEVVGMVGDVKYAEVREAAPPTVYVPFGQSGTGRSMVFELRTAGEPTVSIPVVRETLRAVDPTVPFRAFRRRPKRLPSS